MGEEASTRSYQSLYGTKSRKRKRKPEVSDEVYDEIAYDHNG